MNVPERHTDVIWICGLAHKVSPSVAGHVAFLSGLNSQFAAKLASNADRIARLEAKISAYENAAPRWTPALKEAVIWRARLSDSERNAVLVAFRLSGEELDRWAARYDQHGLEGLKTTRLQTVGGGEG